MLNPRQREILTEARAWGWVMEPLAKALFAESGLAVPRNAWARDWARCREAAANIGFPVVLKVVSPQIMHKTEVRGVTVGITDEKRLHEVWIRYAQLPGFAGVLVEELVVGAVELIAGAKIDAQFGPVILLGIGGTGVEIYKDAVTRMAPLREADVTAMVARLTGHALLEGHRGAPPVDLAALNALMVRFSELVMDLADEITSIDLNPVMATPERCFVADARILLRS